MSLRGFEGYGIGPRAPPRGQLGKPHIDDHFGDSLGGFTKTTFLGTVSVPLDLKVKLSFWNIFLQIKLFSFQFIPPYLVCMYQWKDVV